MYACQCGPTGIVINLSEKKGRLYIIRLVFNKRIANRIYLFFSFHVGSGVSDAEAYVANIKAARYVFDVAAEEDMHLTLLDIGGGFYGDKTAGEKLEKVRQLKLYPFCWLRNNHTRNALVQ